VSSSPHCQGTGRMGPVVRLRRPGGGGVRRAPPQRRRRRDDSPDALMFAGFESRWTMPCSCFFWSSNEFRNARPKRE
jgi:hypothetical protein